MKTKNNTVLISGGSAGIGLEIAKALSAQENKVIITGRNKERLDKALKELPGATGIQCDVTNENDVKLLIEEIKANHPNLNVVINNAGAAHVYKLSDKHVSAHIKALDEIQTNYISVISLNEQLLPLLQNHKEAAIVNVSSVVALVPGTLATYSASKAALHSYTQSLRIALNRMSSPVKVFELMPPLVNTEFSAPIGGQNGISPTEVAQQFFAGFEKDHFEIRVGKTEDIYRLFLTSPSEALKVMNPEK